ncbi:carbohydrate-binding domain-containing protein [Robertmurraya massiliosenegalensis]|uniref:carbohydrate-binding domain-containing protein n=1 Tax=Robertmurraya TaxID=2837507 RepID=UPI0039A4C881
MKKKTIYYTIASTLLSMNLLVACSDASVTNTSNENVISAASKNEISDLINEKVSYDKNDFYTEWENENPIYIELNGTDASFDSSAGVIFNNQVLTIKTSGVYVLSGNLEDGKIVVDAEDKNTVKLVLNGVEISNSTGPAIQVDQAEKTVISLVENTTNIVSDGETYQEQDSNEDEPNAAIFSKDDLTINGTGTLNVKGNFNNGITSKDELKIMSGKIEIDAADDGLMGRDLVAVKDGELTIQADGDGIKSTNAKDESKGTIALEGGTFQITSGNDGIQAVTTLLVAGGTYTIVSGDGSPETINNFNDRMGFRGETNQTTSTSESASTKGLKATEKIVIAGGIFTIDALDDALHSNDSLRIMGGEFTIASGDDGIHADSSIEIDGGNIDITKSYEGIESKSITINDGAIKVVASDDGINIAGGNDGSGMDMQAGTDGGKLQINGGEISVDAGGDGLDANGSIVMTDGTVIVNGPVDNGNGALDYDKDFEISGGVLVAVGSTGMAQATSETSEQTGIMMTYSETQQAGTMVHLEDSEGNTVLTFSPLKNYQSLFISSPQLKKDETYTLYSGGTSTGNEINGLYREGDYQDGTNVVDFKIAETITWLNETGITTANTGGPGRQAPEGGGRPNFDGSQTPENGTAPEGKRPDGFAPEGMFTELDDETKEQVEEIMKQQREGSITREEAQAQLAELGIEMPSMGNRP